MNLIINLYNFFEVIILAKIHNKNDNKIDSFTCFSRNMLINTVQNEIKQTNLRILSLSKRYLHLHSIL